MKPFSIPAVMAAALSVGIACAQLPEVKPQPEPKGTTTQRMDDETITAKVKDAISSDPELKNVQLTVETTDSVVTLSGTATASDEVARAVALARSVPGVKSVVNILSVVKPT